MLTPSTGFWVTPLSESGAWMPAASRIVGIGKRSHCFKYASHFIVSVRAEAGEDFHHPRIEPLLIGIERVPSRKTFRPCREFRVWRNNAELLLAFQSYLAIAVPSRIKLAFELVDPLLRDVMRGMSGPRCHVKKERPLRIDCFFALHP